MAAQRSQHRGKRAGRNGALEIKSFGSTSLNGHIHVEHSCKVDCRTSRLSRARRERLSDIGRFPGLTGYDKQWLEIYVRAIVWHERAAIDLLAAFARSCSRKLRKQLYDEDRARKRDCTYRGARQTFPPKRRPRYSIADYQIEKLQLSEATLVRLIDFDRQRCA